MPLSIGASASWLAERLARLSEGRAPSRRPSTPRFVWVFLVALSALLVGYMFLGRGFAHLGLPPAYIGEVVLFLGLLTTVVAFARLPLRPAVSPVVWLLLGFMLLGFARTAPYLGLHGVDALRDAVLWGYGIFALMVYVLVDRVVLLAGLRIYGRLVPVFAAWLPIGFGIFVALSAGVEADERGSEIPIVFFRSGDMAVHAAGALAFLVIGAGAFTNLRTLAWRAAITVPLLWAAFVVGATNRGALVTIAAAMSAIVVLAFLLRRSRNWISVLIAAALLVQVAAAAGIVRNSATAAPAMTPLNDPVVSSRAPSVGASPPAAAAACDADPSSRSLVANPGFELGALPDGTMEEWELGAGRYTVAGGGGYRGAHYAFVQNTGGPSAATLTSNTFCFDPGHDITVSLWVKAIAASPMIETHVNWYDGSGLRIGSDITNSLATDGLSTWQVSAGVATAPVGTTHAEIHIAELAGNATIGIDEVIAKSASHSCDAVHTSRSLVDNPGFEAGNVNDDTVQGWNAQAGQYRIVAGGGHDGANYAFVHNTGGPSTASIASCRFPFQAGHDVSVSLWARAIGGAPKVTTYVNWYDSSGTRLSSALVTALETGGVTTWQQLAGVHKAPANTEQAQVLLREETGGATMGIDEVVVLASATSSLVTNPDFELGGAGNGSISGWELADGVGNIVEAGAYSGERFASLQSRDEPYTAAIASNKFPVATGVDLSVTLQIRAVSGSPSAVTFVNWYDDSGAQIANVPLTSLPTGGVTTWQESTGLVAPPPDATQAQVVVWEATGRGATIGIDQVTASPGEQIPSPEAVGGRPVTIDQIIERIASTLDLTADDGLDVSEPLRLRWWGTIISYTVFGEYFWSGKGFGINLADADGFQASEDRPLRAPHNIHVTLLARMGVPGFALWVLLQGVFVIGLLRSVLVNRQMGDIALAVVGAWILAYWTAMMVNTSFDSYLQTPQGGIWFWSLFGLGMVVMDVTRRRRGANHEHAVAGTGQAHT